ncbi:DUF4397 domain-containing protein [Chitiniphilus eburneus]|uniref:DUF4397 domain-containing protein n=1 Tax=Chitiniphilus eburneus TaxID=2571148 RepID=A0A4U0PRP8_9NEIS|nr:DUF4397 domain-containing protein [Chitiniphilus eburneus]TJZ71046.1 DUF4397 domain-containing protein [Chitiniphilus eburneus]
MKLLKLLLLATATVSVLSACGGSDDDLDDRLNIADPKLRFVHAVPAGPNVTLYRNGNVEADATDVGYKYASKYYDIGEGNAALDLKTVDGATTLGSNAFDAQRGHKYTSVALIGDGKADLLLIDDPYNKGITSDNARVRVVNAAFNAQNVDVYLTDPGVDLATQTARFVAVPYKTAKPDSGSDSEEMEGQTYQIRITEAGTQNVIFSATTDLPANADWLLLVVPADGIGALVPNNVKVLVAKSDDDTKTTMELSNTP